MSCDPNNLFLQEQPEGERVVVGREAEELPRGLELGQPEGVGQQRQRARQQERRLRIHQHHRPGRWKFARFVQGDPSRR